MYNEENIKNQLKDYILEKVKELDNKNSVQLKNIYPDLLEDVLGNAVEPYELNGADCDYWFDTSKYSISGTMKYGTAKISLLEKEEEESKEEFNTEENLNQVKAEDYFLDKLPKDIDLSNYKKYYFTFGSGQLYAGFCQPIIAESFKLAQELMIKIYGTKWSMYYSENQWDSISYKESELPKIYAISEMIN